MDLRLDDAVSLMGFQWLYIHIPPTSALYRGNTKSAQPINLWMPNPSFIAYAMILGLSRSCGTCGWSRPNICPNPSLRAVIFRLRLPYIASAWQAARFELARNFLVLGYMRQSSMYILRPGFNIRTFKDSTHDVTTIEQATNKTHESVSVGARDVFRKRDCFIGLQSGAACSRPLQNACKLVPPDATISGSLRLVSRRVCNANSSPRCSVRTRSFAAQTTQ